MQLLGCLAEPRLCSLCHLWDRVVMWSFTATQRWFHMSCYMGSPPFCNSFLKALHSGYYCVDTHTCDKVTCVLK